MQIELAAMRHQRIPLEAVDVDARDRDFGARGRDAPEFTGMGAGESAARYAVRTVDEDFFDFVLTIGKAPNELLQMRPPLGPPDGFRTTDLSDQPGRDQRLDGVPVASVQRRVEALHQFPDRVIVRIRHEANDIYPRTLAMIVSANRSIGSR